MRSRRLVALTLTAAACSASVPPFQPAPPPAPIDAGIVDAPPLPPDARADGAIDAAQRALAEQYAAAHGIKLYSHHLRYLGNRNGLAAPIVALTDGSLVVIGTRVTPRPGRAGLSTAVAARFDPGGATRWELDFTRKGFPESEGGSALAIGDGVALYVLSYVNPAWGGVTRVVRVDGTGAITWEWLGRGKGSADTPFADELRLTPAGHIAMDGHIYKRKGGPSHAWRGELDPAGTLIVDETGAAETP